MLVGVAQNSIRELTPTPPTVELLRPKRQPHNIPISQRAWPIAYFTWITVLASHYSTGSAHAYKTPIDFFYYAVSRIVFLEKQLT
jgi:hypothetical protein